MSMAAMAGQQQPPQEPQPEQQEQQPDQQGSQDGGNQEMFEAVAEGPLNYIYSEEGLNSIKQMLTASDEDDADDVISQVAGKLMVSQALEARNNGKMIPPSVMFALCMELINNLTDIAVKVGTVDQANANDVGEDAFFNAVSIFGESSEDLAISDQEREQYVKMVDEMEQLIQQKGMNQEGEGQQQQQEV